MNVSLLEGDHFLLAKRADEIQKMITDWLSEQEAVSAHHSRPATGEYLVEFALLAPEQATWNHDYGQFVVAYK